MEEKTLYLPTEHNDRIIAFIGSPLELLAAWLVLINTVTFLIFGVDKLLANHPRFRQRGCPAGDVPLPPQDAPPGLSGGRAGDPGRAAPAGGGHCPVLEFPAVILF